jgi:hypothetical protein
VTTSTYDLLRRLHAEHGPREFGKICQKLIALAYRQGGCQHVVERGVQGVDVDCAWHSQEKFATEVKTTQTARVQFMPKDAAGLSRRACDGYQPLLAVLRVAPLSEWLILHASHLEAKVWLLDSLRPYRCPSLEARIQPLFEQVVEAHFDGALAESQVYLDAVLRREGIDLCD